MSYASPDLKRFKTMLHELTYDGLEWVTRISIWLEMHNPAQMWFSEVTKNWCAHWIFLHFLLSCSPTQNQTTLTVVAHSWHDSTKTIPVDFDEDPLSVSAIKLRGSLTRVSKEGLTPRANTPCCQLATQTSSAFRHSFTTLPYTPPESGFAISFINLLCTFSPTLWWWLQLLLLLKQKEKNWRLVLCYYTAFNRGSTITANLLQIIHKKRILWRSTKAWRNRESHLLTCSLS